MKRSALRLLPLLLFSVLTASAQTLTLYPPLDPETKKYDEGKACFSFKYGRTKAATKTDWQLGYGFLSIGEQDFFTVKTFAGNRTVIKDLGGHKWEDSFALPVLEPLPKLAKGEHYNFTIDASADTHKKWAETASTSAQVISGHIYLVHIKDETADFYAMFRVEEFEPRKLCTISWRLAPTPGPSDTRSSNN
jgi:hypothetical protein